jgi:hypothetical protein
MSKSVERDLARVRAEVEEGLASEKRRRKEGEAAVEGVASREGGVGSRGGGGTEVVVVAVVSPGPNLLTRRS